MKFTPGQRVRLSDVNGETVLARPYFYTDRMGGGIHVELYVDAAGGQRLSVVDEAKGLYQLGARLLMVQQRETAPNESNRPN